MKTISKRVTVGIKPLSANQAYCGKKVKTAKYRKYECDLLMALPNIDIPSGELGLRVVVSYSSSRSDIDNCLKPFIDILQKRYDFNDNRIYKLIVTKKIVAKGDDSISFSIEGLNEN